MKLQKYKYLLVIFLLSLSIAYSQGNGVITGRITNKTNNQPLSSINIRVVGTALGAVSNKEGLFAIKNMTPGIYTLQVTAIGFETHTEANISVTNAKPVSLDIELNETVIQTQGIEVVASYFDRNIENSASSQNLSSQDIRRAPGVQEDVVRATQLLPGVGISSAGRNDLVVRGGAPFENLFVVDNFEVPNINHFGTQGSTGGPLSLINIDFVQDVQFSSGAYSAAYGDKTSSITNLTLRHGNEDNFGGQLNLSATGFGANIEGPISDKGSYWFSARRSYLDFIFKAAGFGFIPQYWDFQTKVFYKLDSKNQISFLTIVALDDVLLNNDSKDNLIGNSRVAVPNQKQYFSAITWKHFFETGYMNLTLGETLTKFETSQNDTNGITVFQNLSKEAETALKLDFFFQLNKNTNLSFGTQTKFGTSLDYNIKMPGNLRKDQFGNQFPLTIDTSFGSYKNGTYITLSQNYGKLQYSTGARMDYYSFLQDKLFLSPRLSIGYQIFDNSLVSLSGGRFYQAPSYIWLIGDPINSKLTPIRADQIVLSYQQTLRQDTKLQVEIYQKWYNNYPARIFRPYSVLSPSGFDDLVNDIPFGLEPLSSSGIGYSRGIEFFIQKKYSDIPLYGLISLTLSDTKFKSLEGDYIVGAYNSPIIFNITAGYRFGTNWEISGKFRYATGTPTTPFDSTGTRIISEYNQGPVLPDFHALDLRLDKRWNLKNLSLTTYLDVQNVYGRENVAAVRWNYQDRKVEEQKSFGILPSIGINFEF